VELARLAMFPVAAALWFGASAWQWPMTAAGLALAGVSALWLAGYRGEFFAASSDARRPAGAAS
jgi:hypothetical protein